MSGFTIRELLYPLVKGDKTGHTFHGNQYREVATDGEGSTQRPPTGQFQLTDSEVSAIANELVANTNQMSHEKANDIATVSISKTLGFDKPAREVASPPSREPDLYRGCSPRGAASLTEPLEHYGMGGGTVLGNGIYAVDSKRTAEEYANGALVKIWLDPDAKIASEGDAGGALDDLVDIAGSGMPGMSQEAKDAFWFYASQPTNAALLFGYQGLTSDGTTVILDRSIMTISTTTRSR